MKKIRNIYLCAALITLLPILLNAQNTYVPDDKFEKALIDLGYDSGKLDDYVPTANISGVTKLNISNKYIRDLTGIESFVALKELNVFGNTLYTIDLSSNTALTSLLCYSVNLTSLNISKNIALTELICNNNNLSALDLSKNIALTKLNCGYNDLPALDLSKNIALTELRCDMNKLTLLELGPSTVLTSVYCIYNNLSSLKTSNNTGLIKLECQQNNITSFNLTANTLLTILNCYNNDITSIDLKTNTKLTRLDLGLNELDSLNLVTNTALEWLDCWANNLTTLELYTNTALTRLTCGSNQLTILDLSKNTELTYLACSNNQLTTLDLGRNIKLTSLQCRYNQLTTLNIKNGNNTLEFMKANGNPDLICIQVDNYEYAVQRVQDLYWSKGSVSSFAESCGGSTYVPDNNFEQALIDIGYDTDGLNDSVLTENINTITSLDISIKAIADLTGIEDFISMSVLNCSDNQLITLDVNANKALSELNCSSNLLSNLTVNVNTELTKLDCSSNQFRSLDLRANTELTELDCSSNQLTSFDISANTAIVELDCSDNQLFSLKIQNGNNNNIVKMYAHNNPNLTCIQVDNVEEAVGYPNWQKDDLAGYSEYCRTYVPDDNFEQALIDLGYDNEPLNDSVPTENIIEVTSLDLGDKNITSLTGIEDFVALTVLDCSHNKLKSIDPIFSLGLDVLILNNNSLDFDDLIPIEVFNLNTFTYEPQDTIKLIKNDVNNRIELKMEAGGNNTTTFQWFYSGSEITGETNQRITVLPQNEIRKYHCEAKQSLLPDLTLYGKISGPEKKCWEVGQLKFCLNTDTWKEGEELNQITSTGLISINSFLYFSGTMTIDTLALKVSANGEFYVDNIPLPGGSFGKYTLLEGEQNLTLIGSEGKIMDFLNTGLSNAASLFGAKLKIDELQFFSRQDTIGVKVGCSAHIPWVSASCGTPGIYTPGMDLKLKNLEITNKGIMSAGFEVENLGLIKKDHCLNKIDYEHNWKKDILTAGADISLPFIKVGLGGGFRLKNGKIDSVAWSVEYLAGEKDKFKAIPIGIYSLGVKGFSGSISGLNQPGKFNPLNLSYELAGTFSDISSEKWYRVKGTGFTLWPKKFKINGDGQYLKPMDGMPYQLKGKTEMSYTVSENRLYYSFQGLGIPITMDEELWLIEGKGNINIHMYKDQLPDFSGNFVGLLTLPKLQNNWFFKWLNTIVDLPITMHTNNKISANYLTLIYGKSLIETPKLGSFYVCYIFDVKKNWYESGFFQPLDYGYGTKSASTKEKSTFVANDSTKTFNVPENNSFGVIEIKSNNTIPKSAIISPSGKKYSESSAEDNILYTESEDENEAFWTMVESTPGDWTIVLENPTQNDSIFTHFQLKDQEFKFSMNQTNNIVTVIWDVSQVKSGQTVNILLDTDNANFDGFKIEEEDATVGSLSFTLDENTPGCNYYLYAQLIDEFSIVETYAENIIENPLASLAPPINFNSQYNTETGDFEFTWNENPTSEVTGYIFSVTDELGNDSVYAILNSNQTNISVFIEDFETKSAKIESYNQDWKIGCAATLPSLVTSLYENNTIERPSNKLQVYPNPTSGNCTIRYFVSEPSKCEIMVFDISGRSVAHPFNGYQTTGFHEIDFKYNNIPNGIYLIKFVNNRESFTVKSILNK